MGCSVTLPTSSYVYPYLVGGNRSQRGVRPFPFVTRMMRFSGRDECFHRNRARTNLGSVSLASMLRSLPKGSTAGLCGNLLLNVFQKVGIVYQ